MCCAAVGDGGLWTGVEWVGGRGRGAGIALKRQNDVFYRCGCNAFTIQR